MKEFEPSPDFVARVMASVRAEAHTCAVATRWLTAALSTPLRWWLAFAGGLMALGNLLRILASFFSPTLCG